MAPTEAFTSSMVSIPCRDAAFTRRQSECSLGAIVERLRVARGWTRKKLLQRAGLTPQYVAIVEQGGNVPSLTTVLELIEVLRGDVAEVMREAYLGRQFLDAIKRADEKNEIALAHASSKRRNECILFMASPRPQSERAIGIGTEAGHNSGRSYDLMLAESDPSDVMTDADYPKIKELGEELFGEATPI